MNNNDDNKTQQVDENTDDPNQESVPTQEVDSGKRPAPPAEATDGKRIIQFYLPGRDKPIRIEDTDLITFGRRDSANNVVPTIDLTNDHGILLGVSRQHAQIRTIDGQYYLEDTNSSNGTWINDEQLDPYTPVQLNSGDQIRLANLMILVYIKAGTDNANKTLARRNTDTVQNVFRVALAVDAAQSEALHNGGVRVTFLAGEVADFLTALEALCRIVREAQDRDAEALTAHALDVVTPNDKLIVTMRGGRDVIGFLRDKLPAFLAEYEPTPDESRADAVAEHVLEELVYKFLKDERATYQQQIATQMNILLSSPLTVSSA